MKYSRLAAALTFALGSGVAMAAPPAGSTTTSTSTSTSGGSISTSTSTNISTQQNPQEGQASQVAPVDLLFDFNSAQLKAGSRSQLLSLATWAKCNPKGMVILEGHADPRGSQNYNLELSGRRAAVVRDKLIKLGVPSDRIVITVYGEYGPKRATFAQDRRVTVRATASPMPPSDLTARR